MVSNQWKRLIWIQLRMAYIFWKYPGMVIIKYFDWLWGIELLVLKEKHSLLSGKNGKFDQKQISIKGRCGGRQPNSPKAVSSWIPKGWIKCREPVGLVGKGRDDFGLIFLFTFLIKQPSVTSSRTQLKIFLCEQKSKCPSGMRTIKSKD